MLTASLHARLAASLQTSQNAVSVNTSRSAVSDREESYMDMEPDSRSSPFSYMQMDLDPISTGKKASSESYMEMDLKPETSYMEMAKKQDHGKATAIEVLNQYSYMAMTPPNGQTSNQASYMEMTTKPAPGQTAVASYIEMAKDPVYGQTGDQTAYMEMVTKPNNGQEGEASYMEMDNGQTSDQTSYMEMDQNPLKNKSAQILPQQSFMAMELKSTAPKVQKSDSFSLIDPKTKWRLSKQIKKDALNDLNFGMNKDSTKQILFNRNHIDMNIDLNVVSTNHTLNEDYMKGDASEAYMAMDPNNATSLKKRPEHNSKLSEQAKKRPEQENKLSEQVKKRPDNLDCYMNMGRPADDLSPSEHGDRLILMYPLTPEPDPKQEANPFYLGKQPGKIENKNMKKRKIYIMYFFLNMRISFS